MSTTRFRAGMIGAGSIAEFHVAAVTTAPDVELVGITDLDLAKAESQAEKWGTTAFASMDALIAAGANVLHILTPPETHAKLAMMALEKGCHVLIETPVTEDETDATKIAALAKQKGLTATVNHSLLYDPQVKKALDAVKSGSLGKIVSIDIQCGSEYPPYQGGPLPPWSREAGYPFRDLGVHCLYLLQEMLGPIDGVDAQWQSLGGDPNLAFDDWRAQVKCKNGMGKFQLTYNTRPLPSQIIIHGTKDVLRVELFAMGHGKNANTLLPKAAERLINAFKFVKKDSKAYQGLHNLIADFYHRLANGDAPAVSVEDAGEVVRWVEKVAKAADQEHLDTLAKFKLSDRVPFMVTGASGSLGKAVVAKLRADGHRVRVFVRRIPANPADGIEYCFGNLGDPVAVDRAVKGADVVIHVGAAMKGGWPEHYLGTVIGTQNVIDACKRYKTRQLVHISSMSVIDWAGSVGKGNVNEDAALEPRAEERGAYTRAKLEAEGRVSDAAAGGLPCVILRPGQIFGGGIPLVNGAVARSAAGRWLILGDGKLELPLVYIDDMADSVLAAVDKKLTHGEIIQIIDTEHLSQEELLGIAGGGRKLLRVPRPIVFALGKLSELPLSVFGKPSPIALYRLQSGLARLTYESDRAQKLLGWTPKVGVREGIRRVSTT